MLTHDQIVDRIEALGLTFPPPPTPPGHYAAAVVHGDVAETAGHLPFVAGAMPIKGALGVDLAVDDGAQAARIATANALASLAGAIGGLDRVERVLRLRGYVVASADFKQHHLVTNGSSDLLAESFGAAGAGHVRASVGISSLPFDAPVEIELSVVIRA